MNANVLSLTASEEEEEENQEEESSSGSEGDEEDESEDEEEPLLKYKRFAKDVVNDLNQGETGEAKNSIECMAVHSKVSQLAILPLLVGEW